MLALCVTLCFLPYFFIVGSRKFTEKIKIFSPNVESLLAPFWFKGSWILVSVDLDIDKYDDEWDISIYDIKPQDPTEYDPIMKAMEYWLNHKSHQEKKIFLRRAKYYPTPFVPFVKNYPENCNDSGVFICMMMSHISFYDKHISKFNPTHQDMPLLRKWIAHNLLRDEGLFD
jgi:hypothetical protein